MPDQPQDIFQDVEPAADAQPTRRAAAGARSTPPVPVLAPEVRGVQPRRPRLPLLVGGAVVLLAGVAVAVVLLQRTGATPSANTATSNVNSTTNVAAGVNGPATNAADLPGPVTNDRDRDGLTDDEEATLKTNVAKADTDGDGLSDYDEAKVYKSNPLKPDSDGDGSTDGIEVEKGYNPNGPGKLLDFEAAKQKLNP